MEHEAAFYRSLLELLDIGVLVADRDGNYLYVNPAYCSQTHRTKAFFAETSIPALKEQGYFTVSVWEQVMQQRKTVDSVMTLTDRAMNRVYGTLTTGVPAFDENGELQYVVTMQEPLPHLNTRIQKGMMNQSTSTLFDPSARPAAVPEDLIAESPQMKQLLSLLDTVAKTDASILISGPSGSGKEVLARYIHRSSRRHEKPFVVLNCSAIPESLIESELFGYEKGAFTGASQGGKAGLIEMADGGTLFLDEINSMPMALQTKLLRVLETRRITRVGAVTARVIDFRLVCASNEDLQPLIMEKRFRSDLFYRINVISVLIPPLRERREDIIPLALHYLHACCNQYSRTKVFSERALRELEAYDWPGNVRELKNLIERIVITSPETEWCIDHLPKDFLTAPGGRLREDGPSRPADGFTAPEAVFDEGFSFRAYMEACEKQLLIQALNTLHTPAAVAKALKLDSSNVYRKMQKYHLESTIRYTARTERPPAEAVCGEDAVVRDGDA